MRYISFMLISVLLLGTLHAHKENIVNIRTINPNIRIDSRYASTRNFTGQIVYTYPAVLMHVDVAHALDAIQQELEQQGLGLLIWDAYRASREQYLLWNIANTLGGQAILHVSNPATSPGYKNRGSHVELTLVDSAGTPLEMPTDFDELTDQAHSDYMNLPEHVIANRTLLHTVMQKYGFHNFPLEWWYFYLGSLDWQTQYPRIELSIEEIATLVSGLR